MAFVSSVLAVLTSPPLSRARQYPFTLFPISTDEASTMPKSPNLLSLFFILLILVACAPLRVLAVPWVTNDDHRHYSTPQRHQEHRKIPAVFPQLTWLRNTAIEKIFGIPPKVSHPGTDRPKSLTSQLPSTLLAKYGGDVVLRFNLTTSHEERALADAADTLFLDVWEFTDNWADIRLREDDVRA